MFTTRNPAADSKVIAATAQSGVAAGTGDATELTSAAIALQATGTSGYLAAQALIVYKTTLAAAETLSLTVKVAESTDGTTFGSDTTVVDAEVLETGELTGEMGYYSLDLSAHAKKRYIRLKVTMDLSAGLTDTFVYSCMVYATGADRMPAA